MPPTVMRNAEKEGLLVLRFWNNEVLGNIEGVLVSIQRALPGRRTPSPQPSPLGGEGVTGEGRGEGAL